MSSTCKGPRSRLVGVDSIRLFPLFLDLQMDRPGLEELDDLLDHRVAVHATRPPDRRGEGAWRVGRRRATAPGIIPLIGAIESDRERTIQQLAQGRFDPRPYLGF